MAKKYRLKHGKHHGRDDTGAPKTFAPGDMVELSDEQFASFKDKFVDPSSAQPEPQPEEGHQETNQTEQTE